MNKNGIEFMAYTFFVKEEIVLFGHSRVTIAKRQKYFV